MSLCGVIFIFPILNKQVCVSCLEKFLVVYDRNVYSRGRADSGSFLKYRLISGQNYVQFVVILKGI